MEQRRILFLTGTRADFGKLKSLIESTEADPRFETHVFVTGMHMRQAYGRTADEVLKCGFRNVFPFMNFGQTQAMDQDLARTIQGLSSYIHEYPPELIIIHGDRVEALAGAITGALNNILVAHIEGGEVSGTVDEHIRHAISKMSHVHLVANETAQRRLLQMGEAEESIHIIGSPDIDLMLSDRLPPLEEALQHYSIPFTDYGLVIFHPVTTQAEQFNAYAHQFVRALQAVEELNYIIIHPNNDHGAEHILAAYEGLDDNPRFRRFPSLRFEYFLILLKHAKLMVGNSSAGIREAPLYRVPTVDVGNRQHNRSIHDHILHTSYDPDEIAAAIRQAVRTEVPQCTEQFGEGDSNERFLSLLRDEHFWQRDRQKYFRDLGFDY